MKKYAFSYIIIILSLILSHQIFPQKKIQASFDYSEGKIFIFYDFQGDQTKNYEVDVKLKRTSDPGFALIPSQLSGDVGEGKFANKKCKIVWELNPDEEGMLEGEDFYFDVTANEISEGGGIPWYYFAGGAVLAGGAAAVLILTKKSSDDQNSPPTTTGFPTPPIRPQ